MVFFYDIMVMGDSMKKIPYILIGTSFLGVLLNYMQIWYVLEGNNKLLESIDLLKYFTILSNLLVGIYFTMYVTGSKNKSAFFNKFFGSVLLSIFFTFVVFASYLEWTYDAIGLDQPASLLNHYVTPILVVAFFFTRQKDYEYGMKDIKIWLIFPVGYLVFLLTFGIITGDFIYPFFQVSDVGVMGLIIAIVLLVGFFFILSFLLVKILSKNKITNH